MNIDWRSFFSNTAPLLFIFGGALLTLVLGLFTKNRSGRFLLLILTLFSLGSAAFTSACLSCHGLPLTPSMLQINTLSVMLYYLLIGLAGIAVISGFQYFEKQGSHYPEFYSLLLFALGGLMLMVSTTHLLIFFIALEIMSIAVYVLVGFKRQDVRSNEASLKYFILGALAAGLILYAMALLFGMTGTLELREMRSMLQSGTLPQVAKLSFFLLMIGFAFKIAAAPFHFWAPDVYEGAPLPITSFMATAVKAAAFGALIQMTLPLAGIKIIPLQKTLQLLAIMTMVVGNWVALNQTNLKRLLAYSSIAHAGYVLVGVCAFYATKTPNIEALKTVFFYLLAYSIVTTGAFAVAAAVADSQDDNADLDHYRGLSQRRPLLAAALSLFMIALTGVPLTAGFLGKFFLFREAFYSKQFLLVLIGLLMSAVSAYYYLKVIVMMYFMEPSAVQKNQPKVAVSPILAAIIIVCVAATLYFGVTSIPKELLIPFQF